MGGGGGEYKVHPAFLRSDNTIRPYILVGAFLGSKLNGQLRSTTLDSILAENSTLATFRDLSRQGRTINYNVLTYDILNCIQLLYKIAFQDLNSQKILGMSSTSPRQHYGKTMSLGNKSGLSENDCVNLFGIEHIFGTFSCFIDGCYEIADGSDKQGLYICNDLSNFGNFDTYTLTENQVARVGYISKISNSTIYNYPVETQTVDVSENKYYCDFLITFVLPMNGIRILKTANGKNECGLFSMDRKSDLTSTYWGQYCRLCYLP